ncbi:MAG TPA: tripartite tricarboxylate transporter substrate binding protein [Roseomonas sp.]|jgi:tripartite-type tricarboxylate transporter receptor subunit TctC
MQRRTFLGAAAAAGLARPALAQSHWPNRPVRFIVAFPPGGGTDIGGRLIGQHLAEIYGQPFVIDNRGGAGGMIGARTAGAAAPDGYTLLYSGTVSIVRDNFDPRTVIQHVARVAVTHNILVVNEHVPVSTVPEFIEYARARPGQLNHGTAGSLTSQHLAAVMFDLLAGTSIQNVHYRGTGPSIIGILANEVQLMFGSMSAMLPLIRDGKVKALATASARRSRLLPDLPTMGEFVPGYAAELTYSVSTPHGVDPAIIRRIEEGAREATVEGPATQALLERGFEPTYEVGDSLNQTIDADMRRWADVLQRAGVRLDDN